MLPLFIPINILEVEIYLMIFSIKLIRLDFLNSLTRILITRKVIDVRDIIDKNLTIDISIP